MAGYSYSISLRARHPSCDPEIFTGALGLEPTRCWKAGEPRSTPKGQPLKGRYPETYWYANLLKGSHRERTLREALSDELDRLSDRKDRLRQLADEGARFEFFIGWFFDEGNSGDVIDHRLMARLVEFRIELSLDVYPASPEWLRDVLILNDSRDPAVPGDVSIFRNEAAACTKIEDWMVEEGEVHALEASGAVALLSLDERRNVVVKRNADWPEEDGRLMTWLTATARAVLEARRSKAKRRKLPLGEAEEAGKLPESVEGLIAYIGFTD